MSKLYHFFIKITRFIKIILNTRVIFLKTFKSCIIVQN